MMLTAVHGPSVRRSRTRRVTRPSASFARHMPPPRGIIALCTLNVQCWEGAAAAWSVATGSVRAGGAHGRPRPPALYRSRSAPPSPRAHDPLVGGPGLLQSGDSDGSL